MNRFAALLFLGFFGALQVHGQTLYALIMADTKDPQIGTGCVTDIRTMQTQIATIGASLSCTVQLTVLQDDRFGRAALDTYLQNLKPGDNDVLLTYYTGHGYTTPDNPTNWPLLKMSGPVISLDQLHQQLRNKKARFCLTIGDCCNDIARPRSVNVRNLVVDDNKTINAQYAALFKKTKGDVLVASCSRGECSYADATEGSYYTRAFKTALDCAVHYNNTATWREVLADAQNRVMTFIGPRGRQTPLYQLNVTEPAPVPTPNASTQTASAIPTAPREDNAAKLLPDRQVAMAPVAPALAIDVINHFLNDLADEQVPAANRLKRTKEASQFFDDKARVNIYVDKTLVDVQPISQVMERLCLNAAKIRTINLIENRSQRTPDASRYAVITIQEIWEQN